MLGWAREVAEWVFMAVCVQNSGYLGKYTNYLAIFLSFGENK
jgi:hypothetical protein